MHILLFTPYFNQPRGNSTTSKRIIHFLQKGGIQTFVFPYLEKDFWHLPQTDVIHILHATRFVSWAQENQYTIQKPYIITMGGTDINLDLQSPMSDDIYSLLQGARFITVFTQDAAEKVGLLSTEWLDKTVVIPQTAWISWNVSSQTRYDQPRILLPAGLRPVKDVLHVLPALDDLIMEYPNLQFTLLGANLNNEVYHQVTNATRNRPWFTYAGVVPYEVMTTWYNHSNIVINTSLSEGQPLAVMEAMAIGKPVIARKIAGNESLIRHNETGWLYETLDEFKEAFQVIMKDPMQRELVIHNAKEWLQHTSSPAHEAAQYIELYKKSQLHK